MSNICIINFSFYQLNVVYRLPQGLPSPHTLDKDDWAMIRIGSLSSGFLTMGQAEDPEPPPVVEVAARARPAKDKCRRPAIAGTLARKVQRIIAGCMMPSPGHRQITDEALTPPY